MTRPPVHLKPLLLFALAATLLLSTGCALTRLQKARELARHSEALQAQPDRPSQRLLILGDSTAVGTGATTGAASVAGLIAQAHPDWTIVNRGVDGARFADLPAQLPAGERFDLLLILCGGNDVIRLTGEAALHRQVRQIAELGSAVAPRMILMPPGNVGNAPFFHAPLSWWMSRRARMLHEAVRSAAAATGAAYVNLYREAADDPFAREPERLHAADGLHPSDAGYAQWHGELARQAGI